MVEQPTTSKAAQASSGRKATSKSASGCKVQQPSKAELKDLQRRQRALERQFSQAEKDHAALDAQSSISARSGSYAPEPAEDQDLTRAPLMTLLLQEAAQRRTPLLAQWYLAILILNRGRILLA